MKVSRRVLARYVATQLQTSSDRKKIVAALAAYIVEHRLKGELDLILADVAVNLVKLGHVEATVTTARPLDESLKSDVLQHIAHMEGATDITISESVDPAILGGIIIETPRKRFDASIATKLKRLRNA
jgi:F0F1-type ATP synthase delta subunit